MKLVNSVMPKEVFKKALLVALIVVAVLLLYSSLMNTGLPSFSAHSLAASLAIFMAGWLVSAIRLKMLVRACDPASSCSFRTFVEARFLGELLARITPSSIGGEPARAYHISRNTKLGYLEAYMLTLYEVYFDVVLTCLVGAIVSVPYLPPSLPVLLVSILTAFAWVLAFNLIDKIKVRREISGHTRMGRLLRNERLNRLVGYIKTSRTYYAEIRSKVKASRVILAWLLTALVHVLWGFSVVPLIVDKHGGSVSPLTALKEGVSAYFLMQAISIIPTPGGSGVAEYGLTLVLAPDIVVAYRGIYYFIPLAIGLAVSLRYLREKG
ncbi:MAG: flippase-like domain-containing protein [Desulfurococcaceae archaeon]